MRKEKALAVKMTTLAALVFKVERLQEESSKASMFEEKRRHQVMTDGKRFREKRDAGRRPGQDDQGNSVKKPRKEDH